MLTLPDDLRDAFKDPLGPVTTDAAELLAAAEGTRSAHDAPDAPLVAVGDVVTYHLQEAGRVPDVALVDGRTEREAVREEVRAALAGADVRRLTVENPPATLSTDLLSALRDAISAPEPTHIDVDGEEDLAALPAILAAPLGSTVVYGQPGEGMVHVAVTPEATAHARELFASLEGDVADAARVLGIDLDE